MALNGLDPSPDPTATPYLHWAEFLARSLDPREPSAREGTSWRPVFVQAKDRDLSGADFLAGIRALTTVRFDPMEEDIAKLDAIQPWHPDAVVFVPDTWTLAEGEQQSEPLRQVCHIIHIGPAIPQPADLRFERADPPAKRERYQVMAGIIDDGLAFLNARFRDDRGSRVVRLWLQTMGQANQQDAALMQLGHLMNAKDINDLLSGVEGIGEWETYRSLYTSVEVLRRGIPFGVAKTVLHAASHGTHMLDVMAGASPKGDGDDAMRAIPILAAQLPPQSVDDTTGERLEIHIIQALRWIILAASQHKAERLVVNLSFGAAAGAKNGSRFIEQQMAREIARAESRGLAVEIVLPFGNEYRSRMVQKVAVGKAGHAAELVLLRDDETPSYVELRSIGLAPLEDNLEIAVEAPTGEMTNFVIIKPGSSAALSDGTREFGRIHHVAGRRASPDYDPHPPFILFAFAPTSEVRSRAQQSPSAGLAMPGHWKIHMKARSDSPVELTLQVQRDDSAYGYHRPGQQAYFDASDAHVMDERRKDLTGLPDTHAITTEGTNTDYVTRRGRGIHVISAARHTPADPRPAETAYGSRGASWTGGNPHAAFVIDHSDMVAGHRAAANASGSAVILTGSSVAAAAFARTLLLVQQGALTALDRGPPPNVKEDRLGARVLAFPLAPEPL